jgi:hypothetical protein
MTKVEIPNLGSWAATINGKEHSGMVRDLINSTQHIDQEDYLVAKLDKLSLYTFTKDGSLVPREHKYVDKRDSAYANIKRKWIYYTNLTQQQKLGFLNNENIRLNQADMRYPILVAVNDRSEPVAILDGCHRLVKAIRDKHKTIKTKLVPEESLNEEIPNEEIPNLELGAKAKNVLILGAAFGDTTKIIADTLEDTSVIIAVEKFSENEYTQFQKTISEYAERITVLDAADKEAFEKIKEQNITFDFIFCEEKYEPEELCKSLQLAYESLNVDGVILGRGVDLEAVSNALREFVELTSVPYMEMDNQFIIKKRQ